jgi:hypothetical protein
MAKRYISIAIHRDKDPSLKQLIEGVSGARADCNPRRLHPAPI